MIFITNVALSLILVDTVTINGEGPIRLVERESNYELVVVDDTGIISTLFSFPKDMTATDKLIPLVGVDWL